MEIAPLPAGWDTTRSTLQKYAHALTAFPRAVAPSDPRWTHVSMNPSDSGLVAASVPLGAGTTLESELDLVEHRIVVRAGGDRIEVSIAEGPSPVAVAEQIAALAAEQGSLIPIDRQRVSDTAGLRYDAEHAAAFLASTRAVVAAMEALNETLTGETTGPHLWPHGFDVATEWYSDSLVDHDEIKANAQIAMGWYPTEQAYLYVNPWPFDDTFTAADLPNGAVWHTDGWYGAMQEITEPVAIEEATALGRAVHDIAGDRLRSRRDG